MSKRSKVFGILALATSISIASPMAALAGDYGSNTAFSGSASPSIPSCTESGEFESFSLNSLGDPYSDASGGTVDLGSNSLRVVKSSDSHFPKALSLVGPSGELRYDSDSDSWVDKSSPLFKDALPFSGPGLLYGVYSGGQFFVSSESGEGVFLSSTGRSNGDDITYTSDSSLNDCIEQAAVAKGMVKYDKSDNKRGSNQTSSGSAQTSTTATATGGETVTDLASTGLDGGLLSGLLAVGLVGLVGGSLLIFRKRLQDK